MGQLAEYIDGLPNLCGSEQQIQEAVSDGRVRLVFLGRSSVDIAGIDRPELRQAVEWLGCPWGHAVAPSTPVRDYRLHVRAWQHHFAAIFGLEALGRVRGFSPAEMALPNHPDVAYAFVRTLNECGYHWLLVQEDTVELPDGRPLERPDLPHRLVCTSSQGDTAEIVAVVKTQGSDAKLVGQMQPYDEAKGLSRLDLAGRLVPPLVTQIADGENGGVMMNEFPPKYVEVVRECSGSRTPVLNVTEYLEQLFATSVQPADLPVIQPLYQHRIWQQLAPGDGPDRLADVIERLRHEDSRFHVEGGSWTSDMSWVRGYDHVLMIRMEQASALFHEQILARGVPSDDRRYRRALFHLLAAETSCYRYWGEGIWTDYGAELARRATQIITHLETSWALVSQRQLVRPSRVRSPCSPRAYPARQAASTRKRGGTGPESSATDG